jgi:hypothetical protein
VHLGRTVPSAKHYVGGERLHQAGSN